jgi:hypothetical protein
MADVASFFRLTGFFERFKSLSFRRDLAVAGRRAEGWSGIAAGDRARWRGTQRP